jgi:flotillin
VLIFSGRGGYRSIKGGRGYRWPLIETVDRIDLTNMNIDLAVSNAYSKGGIPLTVHGVANLKIAGHQPLLGHAIERLMGMDRRQIIKMAKDTLEGNLRGVLSQLTPEQVNQDKLRFAEKLQEEADKDLSQLGLVLDTLKIQNVADDVGYLDSLGRRRACEVIKRARIDEAQAKSISTKNDAVQNKAARIREIQKEMAVLQADTSAQVKDATTAQQAMIAEQIGEVNALIKETSADLKVQGARVEQEKLRLEADLIAPAKAKMEQKRAQAQGRAAKIIEDGRATVAVLNEMITTWKQGGDAARDIFLMQKLQTVMGSLVNTIDRVKVDRITMLPGNANSRAQQAVTLVEELKAGVGVDIPALMDKFASGSLVPAPEPEPSSEA